MKQNNKTFFEQLPEPISAAVADPNSPPTSYATPEELPSDVQDVVPMDIDLPDSPVIPYAP